LFFYVLGAICNLWKQRRKQQVEQLHQQNQQRQQQQQQQQYVFVLRTFCFYRSKSVILKANLQLRFSWIIITFTAMVFDMHFEYKHIKQFLFYLSLSGRFCLVLFAMFLIKQLMQQLRRLQQQNQQQWQRQVLDFYLFVIFLIHSLYFIIIIIIVLYIVVICTRTVVVLFVMLCSWCNKYNVVYNNKTNNNRIVTCLLFF